MHKHPNLRCFIERVASHPERLQYIYFDTILMLRAVARLEPYLKVFDYCSSGTHEDDARTLQTLSKVLDIAKQVGRFDESVLFRGENANIIKEEFKTHFRNVSRIMDCIGCDKCRLWGKVQTTGLATALKVLFELDEKALDPRSNINLLQRSEVVALINTLFRFSESLAIVEEFRKMWRALDEPSSQGFFSETEDAAGVQAIYVPPVKYNQSRTLIDSACERLRTCGHFLAANVTPAISFLGQAVQNLLTFFRHSRIERTPGNYQGDL